MLVEEEGCGDCRRSDEGFEETANDGHICDSLFICGGREGGEEGGREGGRERIWQ